METKRNKNSVVAIALRAEADKLMLESKSFRRPQELAYNKISEAKAELREVQAEYDNITKSISDRLAQLNDLSSAYRDLIGEELPRLIKEY